MSRYHEAFHWLAVTDAAHSDAVSWFLSTIAPRRALAISRYRTPEVRFR